MRSKPAKDDELPDLLLNVTEVAEILSLSRRSVWRYAAAGKLPRPVRLNRHTVRWRASDIQRHLDTLAPVR